MTSESGLDHGEQPLSAVMQFWGVSNHDLVMAAAKETEERLTHKQVQRGRKGRQLTLRMMQKVTRALNAAVWGRLGDEEKEEFCEYMHKHLFSYAKGFDKGWQDPNSGLRSEG